MENLKVEISLIDEKNNKRSTSVTSLLNLFNIEESSNVNTNTLKLILSKLLKELDEIDSIPKHENEIEFEKIKQVKDYLLTQFPKFPGLINHTLIARMVLNYHENHSIKNMVDKVVLNPGSFAELKEIKPKSIKLSENEINNVSLAKDIFLNAFKNFQLTEIVFYIENGELIFDFKFDINKIPVIENNLVTLLTLTPEGLYEPYCFAVENLLVNFTKLIKTGKIQDDTILYINNVLVYKGYVRKNGITSVDILHENPKNKNTLNFVSQMKLTKVTPIKN